MSMTLTSRRSSALIAALVVACILPAGCDGPLEEIERELVGGTDITFIVAADTHFGFDGIDALNKLQIQAMNSLPGTPYPPAVGGVVARPLGVLIAGDLTERGYASQWKQFVSHYGLTGKDGLLKYAVYEGTGNHDRDVPLFRAVLGGVKKRHGRLTYSWDWSDVHLVNLDQYPSAANLRWLKRDLASVGRKVPIVIYFHFSILGPYSDWWKDGQKEAFARAIDGYNVIGIFHGHYHGSQHYRWRGYDVYNVGSPRHAGHSFAVVHITDAKMSVASWGWDRPVPRARGRPVCGWQWRHVKPINHTSASARGPKRPSAETNAQPTSSRRFEGATKVGRAGTN